MSNTDKRSMPSIKSILKYWASSQASKRIIDLNKRLSIDLEFNDFKYINNDFHYCTVDGEDNLVAHSKVKPFCFSCYDKYNKWEKLERCHIIPRMLGGLDNPSNLIMLCTRCHLDNPNTKYEDIYFKWLDSAWNKKYIDLYYELKQALNRFDLSFDALGDFVAQHGIDEFNKLTEGAIKQCGIHHGKVNKNSYAGTMSVLIKEYNKPKPKPKPRKIGEQLSLF
jgi:5-methylcytosine-specific restriction endonuclease McrA